MRCGVLENTDFRAQHAPSAIEVTKAEVICAGAMKEWADNILSWEENGCLRPRPCLQCDRQLMVGNQGREIVFSSVTIPVNIVSAMLL